MEEGREGGAVDRNWAKAGAPSLSRRLSGNRSMGRGREYGSLDNEMRPLTVFPVSRTVVRPVLRWRSDDDGFEGDETGGGDSGGGMELLESNMLLRAVLRRGETGRCCC